MALLTPMAHSPWPTVLASLCTLGAPYNGTLPDQYALCVELGRERDANL